MSKAYYRHVDKTTTNKAYLIGRDFEYKVMGLLRRHGWHTMRRFGSQGVVFCAKCFRNVSRKTFKCPIHGKKHVLKASLDLTAYRKGTYLLITCKTSEKHGTVYIDDQYWRNLVIYAYHYGAIPIFAGNTPPPNRKVYFVDLATKIEFMNYTYRYKSWVKPEEQHIKRLLAEAWEIIDRCNIILGLGKVKCPKCGVEVAVPDVSNSSEKAKARWAELKSKQINVINKLLWRSGATSTEDDLSKILTKSHDILTKEEKKEGETNEESSSQ